jgi:hypothetical protein
MLNVAAFFHIRYLWCERNSQKPKLDRLENCLNVYLSDEKVIWATICRENNYICYCGTERQRDERVVDNLKVLSHIKVVTLRRDMDWMIGFIDHLCTPLQTAGNYSAIADLHT